MTSGERTTIRVDSARTVSALFDRPHAARALLVLAHGAGAGMAHPSLQGTATGLAERGIATLHRLQDADHAFHVPARSGRRDSEVQRELIDALAGWVTRVI